MIEPRQIAVVTAEKGYAALLDVLRNRQIELNVSCETIDDIAGLPVRYTQKVLSGRKALSHKSFGPIMGAMGLDILIRENPAALKRVLKRLAMSPRQIGGHTSMHAQSVHLKISLRKLRQAIRKGGMNSRKFVGKRMARRLAKKAARARWRKPKVVEIK